MGPTRQNKVMGTVSEAEFRELALLGMPAIANYARRRLYPLGPQALDDVVEEVLSVAWRRRADIPEGAEIAWLIGVTKKVLSNARRKQQRRNQLAAEQRPADPSASAEEHVIADVAVREAMAQLTEVEQELLRLHYWEGLEIPELATLLSSTTNATAVRLTRARQKFREALEKNEA